MPQFPPAYRWIDEVRPLPRMVAAACQLYGTIETPGAADNPVILDWAKEAGLSKAYSSDAVPWCGLFMAVVARRAKVEQVARREGRLHRPAGGELLIGVARDGRAGQLVQQLGEAGAVDAMDRCAAPEVGHADELQRVVMDHMAATDVERPVVGQRAQHLHLIPGSLQNGVGGLGNARFKMAGKGVNQQQHPPLG